MRLRPPPATGHRILGFALPVLTAACTGPEPSVPAVTVRDSAGVEIVESTEPRWTDGSGWRLDTEPEVVIGAAEGDERYLFDRITSVRRFDDGRIAVVDLGASRVRVYDARGRHLFDAGGPGEGPGEFQRPWFLTRVADTIVVYQSPPARFSWFDDAGAFLRTFTVPQSPGDLPVYGYVFGRFDDGSYALSAGSPGAPAERPGRARESATVRRLQLDPPAIDELFTIPTEEVLVHPSGGWNDVTFGRTTYVAADEGAIYSVESGGYAIEVRTPQGVLRRIIRRPFEARPVTDASKGRYVDQLVASQTVDADRAPLLLSILDDPDRVADIMPAVRLLAVDRTGHVWAEDWDDVGVATGPFSVFDPDGVWLGRVPVPDGLPMLRGRGTTALDIGDDWFLGVWTGEYGVEEVRLYRIHKDGA